MGLYVFLTEPLWVLPALEWMTPGILYRLKTREALVALSFDDGPHAVFTPEVLEILERYGAKATFFLIGERAERHPELVERIRAAGHEIGNHCWRDGTVLGHSRARFEEELERTEAAIGRRGEEEKDLTQRPQREEHRGHRESAVQKAGLTAATVQEGPLQKPDATTAFAIGGSYGEVDIEDAALKGRLYKDVPIRRAPVAAERFVATAQSGPLRKAGPTTAESKKKQIPNPPKGGGFGMTIKESGDASIEHRAATAALKDRRYTDTIELPTGTRFFRAPGGVAWPWQLRLARERGYTCVLGCAYPHDPMRPPVKYIRCLIEKNLRPGTIVILHDGIRDATRSVAALPAILEEGTRRGFRFVSIGELVDSRGETAGDEL